MWFASIHPNVVEVRGEHIPVNRKHNITSHRQTVTDFFPCGRTASTIVLRATEQQVLRQGRKRQETQTITGTWAEIISNSHETKVLQPNGDRTEQDPLPFGRGDYPAKNNTTRHLISEVLQYMLSNPSTTRENRGLVNESSL